MVSAVACDGDDRVAELIEVDDAAGSGRVRIEPIGHGQAAAGGEDQTRVAGRGAAGKSGAVISFNARHRRPAVGGRQVEIAPVLAEVARGSHVAGEVEIARIGNRTIFESLDHGWKPAGAAAGGTGRRAEPTREGVKQGGTPAGWCRWTLVAQIFGPVQQQVWRLWHQDAVSY